MRFLGLNLTRAQMQHYCKREIGIFSLNNLQQKETFAETFSELFPPLCFQPLCYAKLTISLLKPCT